MLIVLGAFATACAAADENTSGSLDDAVGAVSQPLITGMNYKPRTFGFVLVDIGMGINLTKDEAQKRLFGTNPTDKSVKQYYDEVSYGTQDISGDILGPFSYPMTTCDTRGVAAKLKPMIGMYDHYLWYFGSRTTACQFSGLAEGGQPNKPTNDTWYNGSANCVVLVQEPGHNFGMMHSSSMTCTGMKSFDDEPDTNCTHNEYGDRYDPMGGACNHMNAWQKVFEGWLQGCNGISINSSGTYTLQPLELACDGPQVLKIPMPKVRPFGRSGGGGLATVENIQYYYLELRTPRGFDSTIRTSPTVLVHVAEDFHDRMDRGRHTWILDMDPTTKTIDGLAMGKSFTDPAGGTSFQVTALSMDSATIQVTLPNGMGPATCLDDTMFDPALPRMCSGVVGTAAPDTGTTMPDGGTTVMAPPRVEGFVLVDASTGKDIRPVEDMATLDLDQLPPNLTLRVDTDPPVVGSVSFRIDAGAPHADSMAPYSITNDFTPWMLALGAHTVNAVASDAANGGGRPGEPYEIDFKLTRSSLTAPPGGDVPIMGGGLIPQAGAAGGALFTSAGTGAVVNPTLASPVAGAGGSAPVATPPRGDPPPSCSCRVVGAGAATHESGRAWALLAIAFGLLLTRRRAR
jgi:MYXO-CTERM domain-containing protein